MKRKNYIEIFNNNYKTFLKAVNPLVGVRGKRLNINALKCIIEEIYSIKYISDNNVEPRDENDPDANSFPLFVFEFLTNKYMKKPMVDQHSLDLVYSIDYYKKMFDEVDMFSKFLNEEYDQDDLDFFLYVRSCIENEVKSTFMENSRAILKKGVTDDNEENKFALTVKSCLNVANSIFGNDEEELLSSFMEKIDAILQRQKENDEDGANTIEAWKILKITLDDYHDDKEARGGTTKKSNMNKSSGGKTKSKPKKNSNSNSGANNSETYTNLQKDYAVDKVENDEEKVDRLKAIIGAYIKEKELDVFFSRLLSSYSNYEKSSQQIEETLASIKDLVSKKVNLLISLLFDGNESGWLKSLKVDSSSEEALKYFSKLTEYIEEMMSYDKLTDIKEDLVEGFSQTLLSTPELSNQINKLVMKRFE
ncbi:MAG: hypothetical protein MJ252_16360 [archaeon]|nr:hypothetical protein [archaeon]